VKPIAWLGAAKVMACSVAGILAVSACSTSPGSAGPAARAATPAASTSPISATGRPTSTMGAGTFGTAGIPIPARGGTLNVYAYDGPGQLRGAAATARPLVYVPSTLSNTLQVIDPSTYEVIARYRTGGEPQHVVPSFDLRTLWVNDNAGNDLIPIDPQTGRPGPKVKVDDPYNLYFTPDGSHALVMAERLGRIDVRDPHTMRLQRRLPVPCKGLNHADYSADLSFFLVTCEFSGQLLVIDRDASTVLKVIDLNRAHVPGLASDRAAAHIRGPQPGLPVGVRAMPQDVRLTPDGTRFVVADMLRGGVWVIDARTTTVQRFIPTGKGAHSVYPDRNGRRLFVANRDAGSITVLDANLNKTALWNLPRGGSPDMGGVSADGRTLWLSGRYNGAVYVIDTTSGKLLKTIHVDPGPHGLCVWPQPGRFSLGHTGNMR
jgi:YVTN family beta-propeller protein